MRNEEVKPKTVAMPRLETVLCKRLGQELPREEHQKCPYCFGRADDIANGQHERFCDFAPGRDPIHFGFPPGTTRDLEG
jgi:hypothetical protein